MELIQVQAMHFRVIGDQLFSEAARVEWNYTFKVRMLPFSHEKSVSQSTPREASM